MTGRTRTPPPLIFNGDFSYFIFQIFCLFENFSAIISNFQEFFSEHFLNIHFIAPLCLFHEVQYLLIFLRVLKYIYYVYIFLSVFYNLVPHQRLSVRDLTLMSGALWLSIHLRMRHQTLLGSSLSLAEA